MEDSLRISNLYATNRKAFVNIMMLEELHLVVVDPVIAIKCGVVTFYSYIIFGVLPVLPYIVTSGAMKQENQPWVASICIAALVLFSLGFIKAVIIAKNKVKSGMEILIMGAAVTAIGYATGIAFPEG